MIMNVTYTGEFSRVKELKTVTGPGIRQLVDRCGMTEEEANQLGEVLMIYPSRMTLPPSTVHTSFVQKAR